MRPLLEGRVSGIEEKVRLFRDSLQYFSINDLDPKDLSPEFSRKVDSFSDSMSLEDHLPHLARHKQILGRLLYNPDISSVSLMLLQMESLNDFYRDLADHIQEPAYEDVTDLTIALSEFRGPALVIPTYVLYRDFLGLNFSRFVRDCNTLEDSVFKLSKVQDKFSSVLPKSNVKPMINFLRRKKKRFMIETIRDSKVEDVDLDVVFEKVDLSSNGKDLVQLYLDSLNAFDFFSFFQEESFLRRCLRNSKKLPAKDLSNYLKETQRKFYFSIIGSSFIPEHLQSVVDNVVKAYLTPYYSFNGTKVYPSLDESREALTLLTSAYFEQGPVDSFNYIQSLSQNIAVRTLLEKRGIDIEVYGRGFEREYDVCTGEEVRDKFEQRKDVESDHIFHELTSSNISFNLSKATNDFSYLEKLILSHKDILEKSLISLERLRSLKASFEEKSTRVRAYVSTDILEALQQGEFMGTCMGLNDNRENRGWWGSVAQVIDSNKNVIYMKSDDGKYLGRARTIITDKGIFCAGIENSGEYSMGDAWVDYLTEFGQKVGLNVFISTQHSGKIEESLHIDSEMISAKTDPAYLTLFFDDNIDEVSLQADGTQLIKTDVYVIPTDKF